MATLVRTAPGRNTRCTPLLGTSLTPPAPIPSVPAHTPQALTVAVALTSNRCPPISSVTTAPVTLAPPSSRSTRAWLASTAP